MTRPTFDDAARCAKCGELWPCQQYRDRASYSPLASIDHVIAGPMEPAPAVTVDDLTRTQRILLALIFDAGADGCSMQGTHYAASATALVVRGLATIEGAHNVATLGRVEERPRYFLTHAGHVLAIAAGFDDARHRASIRTQKQRAKGTAAQ